MIKSISIDLLFTVVVLIISESLFIKFMNKILKSIWSRVIDIIRDMT